MYRIKTHHKGVLRDSLSFARTITRSKYANSHSETSDIAPEQNMQAYHLAVLRKLQTRHDNKQTKRPRGGLFVCACRYDQQETLSALR